MNMNKVTLLPINFCIRCLRIITGIAMYASGLIIYITGGIIALVAVSCCFFGLVTGDGVRHIAIGSIVLLVMLAGASGASAALVRMLERLKTKIER